MVPGTSTELSMPYNILQEVLWLPENVLYVPV